MAKLTLDISMSVDGFIAGPNQTLEQPLGEGGEQLHEWVVSLASWRERHGLSGGETGPASEVVEESIRNTGATVMGRRMFSVGQGPWEDDPNGGGWWGDDPPFRHPVFILTHYSREPVTKQNGTTFAFVTDGIEAALKKARAAAGDKDVAIGGGANVVQQYLKAGLLDELEIHLVPVLLGDGVRLFDNIGSGVELECIRTIESPAVTHITLRMVLPGGRDGSGFGRCPHAVVAEASSLPLGSLGQCRHPFALGPYQNFRHPFGLGTPLWANAGYPSADHAGGTVFAMGRGD